MIKHIVMWTFADQAEGADKATNLALVRDRINGLRDLIPGIIELEPVIPVDPYEHSYDLVLYSVFDSPETLQAYAIHPDHVVVASLIKAVATARVCVDYEV